MYGESPCIFSYAPLICGAGFAEYAIILAVGLTIVVLVLERFPLAKAPMILVVNAGDVDAEPGIIDAVKSSASHYTVKSRNMTSTSLDMTVEVRTKEAEKLVKSVMAVEGVEAVFLLEHDGEATF